MPANSTIDSKRRRGCFLYQSIERDGLIDFPFRAQDFTPKLDNRFGEIQRKTVLDFPISFDSALQEHARQSKIKESHGGCSQYMVYKSEEPRKWDVVILDSLA